VEPDVSTTGSAPQLRRAADAGRGPAAARRRASRSLWEACEALLAAAEPRSMNRAMDGLLAAFECDGVALHVLDDRGAMQPMCARGAWQSTGPGKLRACVSVPLSRGTERIGSLDLWARPGHRWRPEQLGMVRTAAGTLGAALGARLELRRLRHQPGRDALTGLPNAQAFNDQLTAELSRAVRHATPLAVLSLDLDHFAAVNSRYGRPAGDRALADAGWLLRLTVRESDVVARIADDQFAVLLPETDLAAGRRCAERLRHALEGHRFARCGPLGASIGVSASPRHGHGALELLEAADRALDLAKKSGRRKVACADTPRTH
jgi:diguanylate cyclase (GGDEF)-like protein